MLILLQPVNVFALVSTILVTFRLCYHFRSKITKWSSKLHKVVLKYLSYQPLVRGTTRFPLYWSRSCVLLELFLVGILAFCVSFRASSLEIASKRAANLALIQMIYLYAIPQLELLSTIFELSWRTTRRLHASMGWTACTLIVFHIAFIFSRGKRLKIEVLEDKWALVVSFFLEVV